MDKQLQTLIGLQRAEFDRATKYQSNIVIAQVALTVFSAVTIIPTDYRVGYAMSGLAFAAAAVWAWLYWRYRETRTHGEQIRRATLLMQGLGVQLPTAEYQLLRTHATVPASEGQKREDPDFYAAQGEPGYTRLAESMLESAFWSEAGMRHSANQAKVRLFMSLAVLVGLSLLLLPVLSTTGTLFWARFVCATLMLLVSSDLMGKIHEYSSAAHTLSRIMLRLDNVHARSCPTNDVVLILVDYNSEVESAPIPAAGVYEKHKDELNRLWKERPPEKSNPPV